ncbi:MAG: hypothetical protein ACR2QM_15925 [Longimicrobiales bacterium]
MTDKRVARLRWCAVASLALLLSTSCATLQQMAALRQVDFSLDGVSEVRLAGIDMSRVRSHSDLGLADAARLARAVSNRELPLSLRLDLVGENPADNGTTARLVQMDWTLLLEARETVSGVFEREVVLPPGDPQPIPLSVSLNLVEFFEGSAVDLFEMALSLAGQGGEPKDVSLRATPTVNTALGPIRYPGPITIVGGQVGR